MIVSLTRVVDMLCVVSGHHFRRLILGVAALEIEADCARELSIVLVSDAPVHGPSDICSFTSHFGPSRNHLTVYDSNYGVLSTGFSNRNCPVQFAYSPLPRFDLDDNRP